MADIVEDEHELDSNEGSYDESAEDFGSSEEDDHWRDSEDEEDQPANDDNATTGSTPPKTNYLFLIVIAGGILCALLPVWFQSPGGFSLLKESFSDKSSGNSGQNSPNSKCLPKNEKLFTPEELARFTEKPKILLGFLGVVYDVTGGSYYHPDGSYHFFAGKDGTRAFLTGEFTAEELRDDISDLDKSYLSGIDTWLNLYDEKYKRVGRVIGSYYDSKGCETAKLKQVLKKIKTAKNSEAEDKLELEKFPPCNSEYDNTEKRGRVWCTTLSGGINRSWTGRPRQLYVLSSKSWRCACLKEDSEVAADEWCDGTGSATTTKQDDPKSGVKYAPDANTPNCLWKHYPDCDAQATECQFRD